MPYLCCKFISVLYLSFFLLCEYSAADLNPSVPVLELKFNPTGKSFTEVIQATPIISAANIEFLDLIEQMKLEVSRLTGELEIVQYELRQIKKDEKDHYIDLDRRISVLNENFDKTGKKINNLNTIQHKKNLAKKITIVGASLDFDAEKSAYKLAFELIKSRQFNSAKNSLENFLLNYPSGSYAGNAYYWLGEIFMVELRYTDALDAFNELVIGFPDHHKIPDSLYKIGVAHARLNQLDKSDIYLRQVISLYPDSSSARLAKKIID